MIETNPYAKLKYREVKGRSMAYIDEGAGDAIVFQHGQPTSSYVWRNVMPHLEGMGRLVACDLIGMGGSDKLDSADPHRYDYSAHRDYLFALWDALNLGDRVVLVLDDWGATLGLDWANQNRARVRGVVHIEGIVTPLTWADVPEQYRPFFQMLRSPEGERMVLEKNIFVEERLPGAVLRQLTDKEMGHYRRPFHNPGEDRRPTLAFPRNLPIDGNPVEVVRAMEEFGSWLVESDLPKLFIGGDPGGTATGRVRDFIRTWRNQTEVTVRGRKLLQEDSPDEIGAAIADFIRGLDNSAGPGNANR